MSIFTPHPYLVEHGEFGNTASLLKRLPTQSLSHLCHTSLSLIVTSDIPHSLPMYPLYLVYMVLLVWIPYCVSILNTWSDEWLIGLFFNHLWGIGNVPSDHVKISTGLGCYLLYVRSPAQITGKLQSKVCLLIHVGEIYTSYNDERLSSSSWWQSELSTSVGWRTFAISLTIESLCPNLVEE